MRTSDIRNWQDYKYDINKPHDILSYELESGYQKGEYYYIVTLINVYKQNTHDGTTTPWANAYEYGEEYITIDTMGFPTDDSLRDILLDETDVVTYLRLLREGYSHEEFLLLYKMGGVK